MSGVVVKALGEGVLNLVEKLRLLLWILWQFRNLLQGFLDLWGEGYLSKAVAMLLGIGHNSLYLESRKRLDVNRLTLVGRLPRRNACRPHGIEIILSRNPQVPPIDPS